MLDDGYDLAHSPTGTFATIWAQPGEWAYRAGLQQRAQDFYRYAQIEQGMPMANAFAYTFHGTSVNNLQRGSIMDQNMATLYQNLGGGIMGSGILGGGDAGKLAQGIHQGLSAGNLRVSGISPSFTSFTAGADALTGSFSRDLYDSITRNFFPGGIAQQNRTQGFTRGDFGDMLSQLSSRGALAGMSLGSISMDGAGKLSKTFDPTTKRRINEMLEASADTLASVRDIFGNQSADRLMREAERISGMTFRDPGSARAIKGRVDQARTTARMYGMSERAYMEFDYNTTLSGMDAAVRASGGAVRQQDVYRFSANATPYINDVTFSQQRDQQEQARIAAENGGYLHVRTAEEVSDYTARNVAKVRAHEASMTAAGYILDTHGNEESRTQYYKLVRQFGNARTPEEREQLRAQMKDLARQQFGGDTAAFDRMWSRTVNDPAKAYQNMTNRSQGVLNEAWTNWVTGAGQIKQVARLAKDVGITALTGDDMLDYQTTFDKKTKNQIAAALKTGDMAELNNVFFDKETGKLTAAGTALGGADAATAYVQKLMTASQQSGGQLGRQLDMYNQEALRDFGLQNSQNKMSREQQYRDKLAQITRDTSYGGSRGKMDWMQILMQGIGGNLEVDDPLIYKKMREEGDAGLLADMAGNEQGGVDVGGENRAQLLQALKDSGLSLAQMMGTETDAAAFEKLRTSAGLGEFMTKLQQQAPDMLVHTTVGEDGRRAGIQIGSAELKRQKTREIESEAAIQSGMQITGMSKEDYTAMLQEMGEDPASLARQEGESAEDYKARRGEQFGKVFDRLKGTGRLGEMVDKMLSDPSSREARAYYKWMKEGGDDVSDLLEKEQARLEKDAAGAAPDPASEKNAAKLQRIREELQYRGENAVDGILRLIGFDRGALSMRGGGSEGLAKNSP